MTGRVLSSAKIEQLRKAEFTYSEVSFIRDGTMPNGYAASTLGSQRPTG